MNIVIIGGGASGLAAAIGAGRKGGFNQITIIEQLPRLGKKILATGNGRCNLTNIDCSPAFYHGKDPSFVAPVLAQYPPGVLMSFFERLGVMCRILLDGKVYPYSLQATAVLDVLRMECMRLGVIERCDTEMISIEKRPKGFLLKTGSGSLLADRVIICTGGKAYPSLGSRGTGYALLQGFGHRLSPIFPALVQIKTDPVRSLCGIKIEGRISACVAGKTLKAQDGEILFTEYGVSGPPVFSLSRLAGQWGTKLSLQIDLVPDMEPLRLFELLQQRALWQAEREVEHFFTGMLHKKVGHVLLKHCDISPLTRKCASLTKSELQRLCTQMKNWSLKVLGTMSWQNAQVTAGGIYTEDFDPVTMQSTLASGLFAAGEVLDIDGECGGYNLHWAFASGLVAGESSTL